MQTNSHDPELDPDVAGHWRGLGASARLFVDESKALASDVKTTLDLPGRVERHPYGTLLAAFGVGYLVAGGLFTPLTRSALRVAMFPFVRNRLLAAITGQLSS